MLALIAAVLAVIAAPALAAPADEVAAGREVAQRLQAGATSCNTLSDADFEHLGEYVMERMLGSRAAHRAMNDRMTAMIGDANTERMHELMGRRYAGCGTQGAGPGIMGPGMMGGGSGTASSGGWGAMMASADFAWMRGDGWRHMSRADWQRVASSWMGPGMMSRTDGWSTGAVLAVVLGGLALGGLAMYAVLRRPWRPRRSPGPAAT
ncbi:MAG TPA: hypothetical protein VFX51_14125 [Solirubrobacteraceae bacterium]|nr:hypothetical protein [Solirubrobacteraceae bacterium]